MRPEAGSDPVVWLASAREHLVVVCNTANPVRMRCFHGQRAVELALKGLLLHRGIDYPLSHSLHRLIAAVPDDVPGVVYESAMLTGYAVEEMYPDTFTTLSDEHATEAVELARAVVEWVASLIDTAT